VAYSVTVTSLLTLLEIHRENETRMGTFSLTADFKNMPIFELSGKESWTSTVEPEIAEYSIHLVINIYSTQAFGTVKRYQLYKITGGATVHLLAFLIHTVQNILNQSARGWLTPADVNLPRNRLTTS
jgi:hypothetical protein